jgi:hypothetical protein
VLNVCSLNTFVFCIENFVFRIYFVSVKKRRYAAINNKHDGHSALLKVLGLSAAFSIYVVSPVFSLLFTSTELGVWS